MLRLSHVDEIKVTLCGWI